MATRASQLSLLTRQKLSATIDRLGTLYRTRKLKPSSILPLTVFVSSIVAFLALLRTAYRDYLLFLSYGPGGIPYNVFGWFVSSVLLRPMGVNVLNSQKFEADADKRSWLDEGWTGGKQAEKRRAGERPKIGPHPIPQRQLDQLGNETVKQDFFKAFMAFASRNPSLIQLEPSRYERHTDAIFVSPAYANSHPNPVGPQFSREVSHIHGTGDYSAHVVLSPQDAKKVIESGWGQLHGLAGRETLRKVLRRGVPRAYVLVYVPRTEAEIETVMEVVKAGVGYMCNVEKGEIAA